MESNNVIKELVPQPRDSKTQDIYPAAAIEDGCVKVIFCIFLSLMFVLWTKPINVSTQRGSCLRTWLHDNPACDLCVFIHAQILDLILVLSLVGLKQTPQKAP